MSGKQQRSGMTGDPMIDEQNGKRTLDPQLIQFVDHARVKGMDHATIRQLLLSAGWKEQLIAEAFCARDLQMAIPTPAGLGPARAGGQQARKPWPRKARDAFLHLLMYGSLYAWATSLILLVFTYIDFAFPDPAWRISSAQLQELLSVIRAQLAIVIVAFPIFMIAWHVLLRDVHRNPEIARGVLRRWLGYLALFVGAITLSADAMTLIYYLLEGQLTARFLLRVTALFLIAGGLVGYLAYTLRSESQLEAEPEK